MGISPSDDETRHPLPLPLSVIPTTPHPAKLPRLAAEEPPVLAVTLPPAPGMHDGASSPYRSSACPVPGIADFEGLADKESSDEYFDLARPRAVNTKAPSSFSLVTPTDFAIGGAATKSLSPLSSLVNRIGNIGRTSPTRTIYSCRTPEGASSAEDLEVVAHRAEVRRLMQKMMRDELQSEKQRQQQFQQLQPLRTYKRSSMSTIKESPADVSGVELELPYGTVATLDGSESRVTFARTFTKSKEDLSLPMMPADKNKNNGEFPLLKLPALLSPFSSQSPQVLQEKKGVKAHESRLLDHPLSPPKKSFKKWSFSSIFKEQAKVLDSQEKSSFSTFGLANPMQTLLATVSKPVFSNPGADPGEGNFYIKQSEPICETRDGASSIQKITKGRKTLVSDSLSSVDEDASVYEAREARVYASGQLRQTTCRFGGIGNTFKNDIPPQSRSSRTTSDEVGYITAKKHKSRRTSTLSRISSLDLPPPLLRSTPGSEIMIPQMQDQTGGRSETSTIADTAYSQLSPKSLLNCASSSLVDASQVWRRTY